MISRPSAFPMRHGQMIDNVARNGRPKKLTAPATTLGMKRQTKPSHEFCHGAPLNDEPLQKNWEGKQVPVTFGMGSRTNGANEADGFALLQEAGRLGRAKE
jgi:hypothetical protein